MGKKILIIQFTLKIIFLILINMWRSSQTIKRLKSRNVKIKMYERI
jgi:hypothetical protein